MNDFTKEELELIMSKLGLLRFGHFEGYGRLVLKIQSLLDNYCDHESRVTGADPVTGEGICVYCSECKMIIGECF